MDTIERKIFVRDPYWDKEILLYDFSLQKGDIILLQKIDNGGIIVDHSNYIVDSTGPFHLIGMESRAIYLAGEPRNWGNIEHPVWVEGLGSLGNFSYPAFGLDIWNIGVLSCYYKNGELLYQSALSKELGGCNINDPWSNDNKYYPNISIYPNPFSDQLTIEGLSGEQVIIVIYDLFGREIYQAFLDSDKSHTIIATEINPGLYLIRLRNNNSRKVLISKIIIKK